MDPVSRTVALGTGLTYHLLEWDAPSDHTVVLLHGFLDNAWTWEATVADALDGKFHLVAPDMRGHGDTERVGAGGYYHFPDYLADLHDLLPRVRRERVSLVGHSMGGSIAAYYAGTYPKAIARLALLEGVGPPEMDPIGPERIAMWLSAWQRAREHQSRGMATLAEAAARLRANDPLLDEKMALRLAERGTAVGSDGRRRFKHDPLHATPSPYSFQVEMAARFWRQIECPVLLVDGAQSMFRHPPEERARRHGHFRHAQERLLEGAGHMMQRHRPAELGRMLCEFLDGK